MSVWNSRADYVKIRPFCKCAKLVLSLEVCSLTSFDKNTVVNNQKPLWSNYPSQYDWERDREREREGEKERERERLTEILAIAVYWDRRER